MARYWSDGYKDKDTIGQAAPYDVTMVDVARWDAKQDPLFYDERATLGSENLLTSGIIALEFQELRQYVQEEGGKAIYIEILVDSVTKEYGYKSDNFEKVVAAFEKGKTVILRVLDTNEYAYLQTATKDYFKFILFGKSDVNAFQVFHLYSNGLIANYFINIPVLYEWALQEHKPAYTYSDVGADKEGTARGTVNAHNLSDQAHSDIRAWVQQLQDRINTVANSDDVSLDQLAELVKYIKDNRELIAQVTTDKVSVTDIIDNLYTADSSRPLSANQGAVLDARISQEVQTLRELINAISTGGGSGDAPIISVVQSDWNATEASDGAIKNKPPIKNGTGHNSVVIGNGIAKGPRSVAEGATNALGELSHAEGDCSTALGYASHAEGFFTNALGYASHAEGGSSTSYYSTNFNLIGSTNEEIIAKWKDIKFNLAKGIRSHVEGLDCLALAQYAHSEGRESIASGNQSHAEGNRTQALGSASHAEGNQSIAYGDKSHTEGNLTQALGSSSHAEGLKTLASSNNQHVQGTFNIEDTQNVYAHIVGNGIGDNSARSNAHTLDWQGNAWYQGSVTSNGADYAEYFEWLDGNPNNEDRVGLLVTLDGEKIKLANTGDEVLGIISGTAAVLGDNYECEWNGKYLTDDFGRVIYDMVEEFTEEIVGEDEEGNSIIEKQSLGFFKHPRINPDYDPEQTYVNRLDRPEWDTVGMLGKLYVRDDGTCQVNEYATVGENGIATASSEKTDMRVLSRVNENIIKVLLK